MNDAYLSEISYYLPEQTLTNEDINCKHPEWSVEKISAKTGIFTRHIAGENEFSSDMAVNAANLLFNKGVDKKLIDYILLCTQSPDYLLPTTACIIQDKLQINKYCGALDFNLGCSGFIYGLGIAKGLIATGQASNVLLLTSETYSKYINERDKSNKTLFGDAAAATLISAEKRQTPAGKILNISYFTDGGGFNHLIVKNRGARYKTEIGEDVLIEESFVSNDDNLFMNGNAIFNFTAFSIPPLIEEILKKNKVSIDEIDLFIFHQANEFMLETVRKRCKIPKEKFFVFLKDCGNTVSSTIPIALAAAQSENKITKGNKVLLCGFGVGLSAGGVIIQY